MKGTVSGLKIPARFKPVLDGVSQSQIQDFAKCPQKWMYRINGLRLPEVEATTNFGNIMHSLLEGLYKTVAKGNDPAKFSVTKALAEHRKKNPGVNPEQMERECAIAEVMFAFYRQYYRKDLTTKKFYAVESRFTASDGLPMPAYAILDAVYRDTKDQYWCMEHKFWGRIDEAGLDLVLGFDFQSLLHMVLLDNAIAEVGDGPKSRGVLYNIVRKPQLRQKQDESLRDFCDRLAKDVESRPEWYFIRREIVFSEADKKRFRDRELASLLGKMKDVAEGRCGVYRVSMNCLQPWKCEFLEACASNSLLSLVKRPRRKGKK